MLITTLLLNFLLIEAMMIIAWLISIRFKDAGVIDSFWGPGFVLVGWFSLFLNGANNPASTVIAVLLTIWGLRLGIYLTWRNWGPDEDRRYAAMREKRGKDFWWISFFNVFTLQAVILWFVALPVQLASLNNEAQQLSWLCWIGTALWIIGFVFESVGDWQLSRFKSDPLNEGKVLDQGLWRFTRHPNYFGDFCVWWGIYLIASSAGAVWTILSPIAMSVFLMKVSGVTLLESSISNRRPDYVAYQRSTNAFFPWLPRTQSELES